MTNRRAYITLAEGIRAIGEVDKMLQAMLESDAVMVLIERDDFSAEKFSAHALAKYGGRRGLPARILRHLPDREGFERAVVSLDDDSWMYGAYLNDESWNGFAVPYVTKYTAHEVAERFDTFEESTQTLMFDGDTLLIVDDAEDSVVPDRSSENVQVIEPVDGLYKLNIGARWFVRDAGTGEPMDSQWGNDAEDEEAH